MAGLSQGSYAEHREGRYNLDSDIKFFATPPYHGSLAEVIAQGVSMAMAAPLSLSTASGHGKTDCDAAAVAGPQFVDHPADFCFRLPEGLTHEEGAFAEPLSVGAPCSLLALICTLKALVHSSLATSSPAPYLLRGSV